MARAGGGIESERGRHGRTPPEALGLVIREHREEAKLSRKALAEKVGVTPATMSGIEKGRKVAFWGTLRAFSAALGTPMDGLIRDGERRE